MNGIAARADGNVRHAIDAALIMAIGMGFGRFAFTAIYPHMVEEGLLSLHGGSLAASANYAGYLLGALLAVRARAHNAHRLCLWSMIGTGLCLALPSILSSTWTIVGVRGVAGVFSAFSMVAASVWLLEHRGQVHRAPLLYAGVGVGIAASAELLVLGTHAGLHSKGLWLLLCAASLIIGVVAMPGLMASTSTTPAPLTTRTSGGQKTVRPWSLVAIYGLAGLGYIVTATYLPLLVRSTLPNIDAAHVWAVFGLGAAPSCFLWHSIHARLGTRSALLTNLIIQAAGVVLPTVAPSATGYLLSALLVGGTFMGTVTIAMPAAQSVARQVRGNLMAIMTVIYGVGQIVGPIAANALYAQSHGFSSSLVAAAAALVVAAAMSALIL
ncbi:MFS family permease [Paraburkholderia terricola]|uniref:MFS family permease n=1 Tax=Paraburkholderia terricola TaxID=169427 RepID=A0ABU1M192_9BURK|nr:YbfB/YjiJ family MFS transporter [Paraburkholderia terricola]MDR6412793.1 MFS family permease [Paraburkholderia terricola]MDR6495962.1 MFS family permease [Paraburkholderia terricola]